MLSAAVLATATAGCIHDGDQPSDDGSGGGGGAVSGDGDTTGFPPANGTEWSDSMEMGGGSVRAFVTRDGDALQYVGVEFTEEVLEGLPDQEAHRHLDLPGAGNFRWVGFDWQPEGHEPPGVYDVPHFDVHFYMMPEMEVEAIEGGPATYSIPDPQIPTGYRRVAAVDTDDDGEPDTPAVTPQMGEHLLNASAPEIPEQMGGDGEEFTYTFIWGAYGDDGEGRITFAEPMITREFLESQQDVTEEVGTPEVFAEPGMYPTSYSIQYHSDGRYTVTLRDFQEFSGA